jgi:hypothetical protein
MEGRRYQKMRFAICAMLLVFTLVGAVMLDGANPIAYFKIPGLIIEVLVPLFALLAVWKVSELAEACKDAFSVNKNQSSVMRSVRIWNFAEKACYAAGALAWLLAMILTLVSQLPPRDSLDLMHALAVGLVAPLYAILFALVCRILRERVKQHSNT